MNQDSKSELSPGAPLQLKVGEESFTSSQRAIMLGTPRVRDFGVLPKELPGFPPVLIKGAIAINNMLNSKAAEANLDSSINVFFYELGKFDTVFLRILMGSSSQNYDLMEMLIMPSGSGNTFVDALQTIDKPTLQKLIGQTLRINADQRIIDSNVYADNLVVFSQSATEVAEKAIKSPANLPTLYAQNKNSIHVHKIPDSSQSEIDLSEFVKKSVFFRNEPGQTASAPEPEQKISSPSRVAEIVETENEETLQEIANYVTQPAFWGKFSKPVIARGVHCPVMPADHMDYYAFNNEGRIHRNKVVEIYDPTSRLEFFANYCYDHYRREINSPDYKIPDGLNFKSSIIFSHILDDRFPDTEQLMIAVPVTDVDASYRPTNFTFIYCTLPKLECNQLVSLIEKNPINAERFIQVAFDGIDSFTGRRPVETVSIVDVAEYLPKQYQYVEEDRYGRIVNKELYKIKKIDYNSGAVKTLHYQKSLPQFQKSLD